MPKILMLPRLHLMSLKESKLLWRLCPLLLLPGARWFLHHHLPLEAGLFLHHHLPLGAWLFLPRLLQAARWSLPHLRPRAEQLDCLLPRRLVEKLDYPLHPLRAVQRVFLDSHHHLHPPVERLEDFLPRHLLRAVVVVWLLLLPQFLVPRVSCLLRLHRPTLP